MSSKTYTWEEMCATIKKWQDDTDNDGQIVFYTNFYKWADGTIHDEQEPCTEPKWYRVFNKDYYDGTGKQGLKCIYTGTKEECESYLNLNVGPFASSYYIKEAE